MSRLVPGPDATHMLAVYEHFLDREALPQLGTGGHNRVDKNLVQHRTPWTIPLGDAVRPWRRTGKGERTEIEDTLGDWRAVGGDDFLQQAPALELSDARLVDVVGGHNVAGERGLVH